VPRRLCLGINRKFWGRCRSLRPGFYRSPHPVGSPKDGGEREQTYDRETKQWAPANVNEQVLGRVRERRKKKDQKSKCHNIGLCGKSGRDHDSPDVIAVDLIHPCPFTRDLCPYCDYSMDREQSPSTADVRYVDVL